VAAVVLLQVMVLLNDLDYAAKEMSIVRVNNLE
jgi:hypothetical protein